MPELGEVEIARRNLEKWWVGRAASQVRVYDPKVLTSGGDRLEPALLSVATQACRRGKYLFVRFEAGDVVVFHFRMTGQITRGNSSEPQFVRLAWRVDDAWLAFRDARRLGHVDVFSASEFAAYEPISEMGPEPYDVDGPGLAQRVGKRGLKAALLDQSVVAGVGNIAVSEVFWTLGLKPDIGGQELSRQQWQDLARGLREFFDAVVSEQASDDLVYVSQGGDNPFHVYGRLGQACPRCGHAVTRTKVAGRSSYYCPDCQR